MTLFKNGIVLFLTILLSFTFISQKSTSRDAPAGHLDNCTLYKWYDPNTNEEEAKFFVKNCANCHMAYYKEWISDKHSMSQNNPFFLSIYSGTNKDGKENIYPGFRLDHPNQNGNCSLCHNPEAALDNKFDIDLRKAQNTNGISCNFCHKIESVDENPLKKGVRGLKVPRVCKGLKDIGFGPLNDIVESTDKVEFKYNELYKKSLYCAKCHDGFQGNAQIYSTFTEWLKSPAAKKGTQCQACHMQPRGTKEIIDNPDVKHKIRPHDEIHNHSFLTENPHEFRKKFLDVKIKTKKENNKLIVTVSVKNKNRGHDFPTGSPMRNAILLIEAKDKEGKELRLIKGSKLSNYAGSLKDKPGKLFAKILQETSSLYAVKHGEKGIAYRETANKLGIPAHDWWNVYIASDTRIKPNKEDISIYEFSVWALHATPLQINAKLIWRNTWPGLAKIKGFELKEDLLIEKKLLL